jgi:hypothetical protein
MNKVIKLMANKGLKPSDIKLAEVLIVENKLIILKAWEAYHGKVE